MGNAFSFLCAWLVARSRGGSVILRIEDVDLTRARRDHVESAFRDLEWLGLDWDDGPSGPDDVSSPFRQSSPERQARYGAVWADWRERGLLYPCRCTRADLRSDAPQVERLDQESPPTSVYSGRCRRRGAEEAGESDAWRLRLPAVQSEFDDGWRGAQTMGSLDGLGDPVVRRGDGIFAYHLAVCVDDADQGVDTVVRGRDLIGFGHLHAHLHSLLGSGTPGFLHHPLLGDPSGARLAKRAGSSSLSGMREAGIDPRAVVGALAPLLHPSAGLGRSPVSARELLSLGVPAPGILDLPSPTFAAGVHP